ncbi:MAG: hypothetical protein CXR31_00385 [Geobacter sp.]|nr:MAG: hypothetical protein CXR31_00385 [Geobacter sp.]
MLDHRQSRTDNQHAACSTPVAHMADHVELTLLADDYEAEQNVAGLFLTLNDWLSSSTTH